MPQTSTTGQLENAQQEMISGLRYTAEHDAPIYGTVSHFSLKSGQDTGVFPKAGQMSFRNLNEGERIIDEQDIGLSTVSVTPGESGLKTIVTKKMLRQNVAVNFNSIGVQQGDAMVRFREDQLSSLFSGLNGGTSLGAAGAAFSSANATAVVSIAQTNKYGRNLTMIQHPNAVMRLARDLTTVGSGQLRPLPEGYSSRLLGTAWQGYTIWNAMVLQTGNLSRDASDDAIGSIHSKDALGYLQSQAPTMERDKDIELRGWVLVMTMDSAAFEYDDTRGAPLTFDAADPATNL